MYSIDIRMHEYAKLSTVQNTMSADAKIHATDIEYLKDRKSVWISETPYWSLYKKGSGKPLFLYFYINIFLYKNSVQYPQ